MSIALDPGESLYAYQLTLIFPPLLLEANSVTALGYFGANSIGASSFVDNENGSVLIFNSLSGTDLLTFSDSLVRIAFDTLVVGSAKLNVDPQSLILLDGNFGDLNVASLKRKPNDIVIRPNEAVPEPAAIILVLGGFAAMLVGRSRHLRQFLLKPAPCE